jgi:vacuolar-type H+-ATPase subunit F/Vma7
MSQPSADMIRQSILDHKAMIPMILEIPAASGGEAYDASKDPIMKRVLQMLGES